MTPALSPNTGSLFTLQGALFELLEERERCTLEVTRCTGLVGSLEPGSMPFLKQAQFELDAINTGIASFVRDKLMTVDDLRAPLKAMEQAVSICKADAQSSMNQAAMWQNRYDRLKDLIKLAMEQLEQAGQWKPKETKKFESPRGSFTLRGNGGAQPVEVTDESMVPEECCVFSARLTFAQMNLLREYVMQALITARRSWEPANADEQEEINDLEKCVDILNSFKREVSRSAVAEELSKACGNCDGTGKKVCLHILATEYDHKCPDCDDDGYCGPCDECGGSGKNGVPGARLAARGAALVVK